MFSINNVQGKKIVMIGMQYHQNRKREQEEETKGTKIAIINIVKKWHR